MCSKGISKAFLRQCSGTLVRIIFIHKVFSVAAFECKTFILLTVLFDGKVYYTNDIKNKADSVIM